MAGTLLVAETALQAHPSDALPGALLVSERESSSGAAAALGAVLCAVAESAGNVDSGDSSMTPFKLACSRCAAVLGSVQLPQREGDAALARLTASLPTEAAAADADAALQHLPPRLAKDCDPYLTLLKDALWLPEQHAPTAVADDTANSSATRNALRAYTPVTRAAEMLLAALMANGQYSFVLAAEVAAPAGGGGDGGGGSSSSVTPIHLTVSSWGGKFAHGGSALLPSLRVHYAPATAEAGAPDILLPAAHFAAVATALLETTAALPPSRRRVGAAWLGFLPLAAPAE